MLALFSKFYGFLLIMVSISACSSTPKNETPASDESQMIENPFAGFSQSRGQEQNITFRSKKGDQQVEVQMPQGDDSEFSMPMRSPASQSAQTGNGITGPDGIDYQYAKQKPTIADREIASTFSDTGDVVNDAKKREIEASLGLQASDELPNMDESYLAKVDVIKQLFKSGRFEAALIEVDHLVKIYPTNGRLYEMRGTVLDRLGYSELAIRSWKQAFEFEPGRLSLKKMIEKREQQRSVASEKR